VSRFDYGMFHTGGGEMPEFKPKLQGVVAYDPNGRFVDPDARTCVAKAVVGESGVARFYVKRSTSGSTGLFDPVSDEPRALLAEHVDMGKGAFEFASVPEEAYVFYVAYLSSHNKTHLLNAQRSIV
jgi:hypothetical protein